MQVRARVQIEGHLGDPSPAIPTGKPLRLRYEVQNVGKTDAMLWHAGFWTNHRVIVRDATGTEPTPSRMGKAVVAAFSPRGARDKNVEWSIAAGRIDATEGAYDLTELYDLSKPGSYTLEVLYEEDITFSTNRLGFRIRP